LTQSPPKRRGRSGSWWLLAIAGVAIILASILMNMDICFRTTSLFNTLTMLVLLADGAGLIAHSHSAPGTQD
jgi:hypothetical protein